MLLKSNGSRPSTDTLHTRLGNRTFGKLKRGALKQAFRIIRDNGGLDIAGEYGSLEINDKDFVTGYTEGHHVTIPGI